MSRPIKDLTGQKFGKWTVLKYHEKTSNGHYWLCQCECGTIKPVHSQSLTKGTSQSCGCLQKVLAGKTHVKDLTGKRFGRLVVLEQAPRRDKEKRVRWICKCDCGNYHEASSNSLVQGLVKSCGCLFESMRNKEGQTPEEYTRNRLYGIWVGVKRRCYNQNAKDYKFYGLKGVKVCEEWKTSFQKFYEWSLLNGYKDTLTIDRINVEEMYEPNNCRWIDIHSQQRNRRNI